MDPSTRQFLDRLRKTLRTILVIDGMARMIGWSLLAAAVVLLLDRFNSFPSAIRLPLIIGIGGLIIVVAVRRLCRPLRQPFDDAVLARIAERRHAAFNGRLFAAVEGLPLAASDEQALREACVPATIQRLVRRDHMLRSVSAGGSLVVMLALFIAVAPHSAWIAVQRLFLPLGHAEWPRSHRLQAYLEQAVVPVDQPLVVVAEGEGSSAPLRIRWLDQYGRPETRMPDALTGPWRERLTLSPGTYQLELRWGDSLPVYLEAHVVERPMLSAIQATIDPPSYAGQPRLEIAAPAELTALPGSQVELFFQLSDSEEWGERAVAAWLDETPLAVNQVSDGWQASWVVGNDRSLELSFTDSYTSDGQGIDVTAKPKPTIPIHVLNDRVPLVRIGGPRRNEAVAPTAIIPLTLSANDDYGLATLRLTSAVMATGQSVNEQSEFQMLQEWPDVAGVRGETLRRYDFQVGELIGPGSQVVLIAEGHDANDVNGPGIGSSDPLLLRVVSAEELRQELDRIIADIRDRLAQSREQLAPGLTDEERLVEATRSSRPVAERASEQLGDLIRRWRTNQFDVADAAILEGVRSTVINEAVPDLHGAASEKNTERAVRADRALGEAERRLTRLLRSDDLARELSTLINRQEQLSEASRSLLKAQLAGDLGADGDQQLENLSLRQQEVADQLREWVRRLLSNEDESLVEAQSLARAEQPAAALQRAVEALAAQRGRQRALAEQNRAQSTMEQLLDQLRGDEAAQELAEMAGDLAARQERLQRLLEAGAPPDSLAGEQERLQADTKQFQERVENETDNEQAAESVEAAQAAQEQAQQAMQSGNQSQAAREAHAAAAQLRSAQRALEGQQEQQQNQDDQEQQNPVTDVLALLKRLRDDQVRIVTKATLLVNEGVGVDGAQLAFDKQRQVKSLAEQEDEIWLQLEADGLESVEDMPIAKRALTRVSIAVEAAFEHLDEPALGQRGLRLTKIALYEMERLLAVVESMPEPKASSQEAEQAEGQSSQSPFPPAAQLALLAAEQLELRHLTAARFPRDLTAAQQELGELAAVIEQSTRPGTRPSLLMQRAVRAMSSAADLLEHDERPATVLSEQDVAVAMIYRLMAEAEASNSQGQSSSSDQQQGQQQQDQGESREQQGDSGDGQSGPQQADGQNGQQQGANSTQGGDAEGGEAEAEGATTVLTGPDQFSWMELAPVGREKLREARDDNVPAEGLQLYRAYLEIIEELDQ